MPVLRAALYTSLGTDCSGLCVSDEESARKVPVAILALMLQPAAGGLEGEAPVDRQVVAQRAQASVRVHPQRLQIPDNTSLKLASLGAS